MDELAPYSLGFRLRDGKPPIKETLTEEYNRRFRHKSVNHHVPQKPVKIEWYQDSDLPKTLALLKETEEKLDKRKQELDIDAEI